MSQSFTTSVERRPEERQPKDGKPGGLGNRLLPQHVKGSVGTGQGPQSAKCFRHNPPGTQGGPNQPGPDIWRPLETLMSCGMPSSCQATVQPVAVAPGTSLAGVARMAWVSSAAAGDAAAKACTLWVLTV